MNAIVGYSSKTVDEVQAEIAERDARRASDKGGRHRRRGAANDVNVTPPKTAMSALEALMAEAKAVQDSPD